MEQWMMQQLGALKGKVGMYYKNIAAETVIDFYADESYLAASVIKLPVCAAILHLAAAGCVDLAERIAIRVEDMVPSCGTLRMVADEVDSLSIRALCRLMITVSDNSATNLLLRRFGLDELNREFVALGLRGTRLERLLFNGEAAAKGRENRFVPREIGELLEKLYRHELVNEEMDVFLEQLLCDQQINHKIPGYLPRTVQVAHKTGEDEKISNDVGIIYSKEPFVLVFACNDVDVPMAERAMREISLKLYEAST